MKTTDLPAVILDHLKSDFPDDPIQLAVMSDLTQELIYGEEWLVVTGRHLMTFAMENSSSKLLVRYPLASISEIVSVSLTGSGLIEIVTDGERLRLIHFTAARKADFSKAVEQIKALRDGKAFEPAQHLEGSQTKCDRCGLPIPDELKKCPRCTERWKTLRRIFAFARPYRARLVYLFLLLVAGTCFGLITPYMSKLFIDFILKPNPQTGVFEYAHWIPLAALALLFAYGAQTLLNSLHLRLTGVVGHNTVYDVRAALYEKLQHLSLSFFDKYQTGALMARVNQDTRELQHFLVDFIPLTLESLLILIGVGIFLFILSWKLTLFVIIPIAATVLFLKKIYFKIFLYFRRFYHRRSRLSALINDSLSGIRVIKAFGEEREEIKKFDRKSIDLRNAGIDLEVKWSLYSPIFQFLIMLGSIIIWFVGGQYIVAGQMSLGDVVAYSGYLAMFYRPVIYLLRMVQLITSSLSAAERVFDVIDTPVQVKELPNAISMPSIEGTIEFQNVTFGYDPYKPVIKNMSFTIHANEIVGLVGKSGAGKSTIINLVCRLYDVDLGAILIDGQDIRKIKSHDLRQQIGVVLQDTFLFNGTIFENIAYAKPDASIEEVIEAAKAAYAHEFIIDKPDGYDTEVGERGNRLSGGEKQRIAIARALLRDPRILILDEATSSLDTETEKKIQDALKRLTRGRTTIAIAHRLSTLRNCDRLFVIDDGRLVEVGTHRELMEKKGIFYNLVAIQRELSKIVAVSG
ncbi:MAG: ABC transporter ATP-binding protein/permease [candidate division KSB1 bacterium]|nr:ABC transporter ATP-binding protein/permease [candidate division KSB1 bacterium]MDZ7333667.1 ABC transporter ATP-binding protein/permease [candidate division KSB1 bacterium]MDZ7356115.1 ABC transporter ATP-binding protein/permease [candidate division KSB1 bacterium]